MKSNIKTVVVGGSFAELTTALELKRKGGKVHDIVLVSNSTVFTFIQSDALEVKPETNILKTRKALEVWKQNPGLIVIGTSQNAGCIGAAYEFPFNMEKWLREEGIRKKSRLILGTSEPFLGHYGIDGVPLVRKMMEIF